MVRGLALGMTMAALLLAGCSGDKAPAPSPSSEAAVTGPDAKPGLSASGGRLVLPAVPGRPGAAYFTLANGGSKEATVAAAFVADAGKAEMHETAGGTMAPLKTVAVPSGGTVVFAPGGKHVMVFDIADTVKAGGTVELTLTFADGDKLSTPLTVEPAGGGMDHAGMSHGEEH